MDSTLLIGVADLWRSGFENEEKHKQRTMISLGAGLLVSGYTSGYSLILSDKTTTGRCRYLVCNCFLR